MHTYIDEQDTSDDIEEINNMLPHSTQAVYLPYTSTSIGKPYTSTSIGKPSTSTAIINDIDPIPTPSSTAFINDSHIMPLLPHHAHNSTTARAYWFVNNKKVSHNVELRIYNVQDEHEKVFQVELLPKAKCTCVATFKCAHILNSFLINENNII